jgi:S1-C subfamily serine protease
MPIIVLAVVAFAAAVGKTTNAEELLQRLCTVSCVIRERSYTTPWKVHMSEAQFSGLLSEPHVIFSASGLPPDSECKVQLQGSMHAWQIERVRSDDASGLNVFSVPSASADFWTGREAVKRAGVLRLGSQVVALTGKHGLVTREAIAGYGAAAGPTGPRLAAVLESPPRGSGFIFDEANAFAGVLSGGAMIPEWTLGAFDTGTASQDLQLAITTGENTAFRQRYLIPETGGVFILGAGNPWKDLAGPGDVLYRVAGEPVGHDGKVMDKRLGVRLPVQLVVAESMEVTVLRGAQRAEVTGTVELPARPAGQGETPSADYLIVGGLVFAPLVPRLLEDSMKEGQMMVADDLHQFLNNKPRVALANVLPHHVNEGFPLTAVNLLHSCNGKKVSSLEGLLKLTHSAIKKEKPLACSFLRISDADDAIGAADDDEPAFPDFVFEAGVLPQVQDEILEKYDVPSSMSQNLCGVAPALDAVTAADCSQKKGSFLRKSTRQENRKRDLLARKHRAVDAEAMEAWWEAEQNATAPNTEVLAPAAPNAEPSGSIILKSPASEGSIKLGDKDIGAHPLEWGEAAWGKGFSSTGVPLKHVVKILTLSAGHSFLTPWEMKRKMRSTGSGIMVLGEDVGLPGEKLILTNAHVVNDAQVVFVQRQDMTRKILAEVRMVAKDVDTAMLRVVDKELWDGIGELHIHRELPPANSAVRVAGYPHGGSAVSITNGVLSRVMAMTYEFSQPPNPVNLPGNVIAMQVDAAINPGNSGGPAFNQDGDFLGLAFAGISGAQSMGFVIPASVILARLPQMHRDAETGIAYPGIPEMGLLWKTLDNEGLRHYLEVPEEGGVLVRSVAPLSALNGTISPGDVLLAVDGHAVAADGTVVLDAQSGEADVRVPLDALVTIKPENETTDLRVFRDGNVENVMVQFTAVPPLLPRYDTAPDYALVGGLIFSKLTVPLLLEARRNGIMQPLQDAARFLDKWRHDTSSDVVVLVGVVSDPANEFYSLPMLTQLHYVNGEPVTSLKKFVELLPAGLSQPFLEFSFDPSGFSTIILNSTLTLNSRALENHAIPSPVSENLALDYCKAATTGPMPRWTACAD